MTKTSLGVGDSKSSEVMQTAVNMQTVQPIQVGRDLSFNDT